MLKNSLKMFPNIKQMIPIVLKKAEGWRRWKKDIEDYVNEVLKRMRGVFDACRKETDMIDKKHMRDIG